MGMGPGGHRDTREASWGVNFLSGTSTSLMSRSAMSASSKPLFQHSARHTQPHGYVASGDDELTANDSLTFELGRRLNIGFMPNSDEADSSVSSWPRAETSMFSSSLLDFRSSSEAVMLYFVCMFEAAFLSNILMCLLPSLFDNEFSTSVLQLSRSELLAKGTYCHI